MYAAPLRFIQHKDKNSPQTNKDQHNVLLIRHLNSNKKSKNKIEKIQKTNAKFTKNNMKRKRRGGL